MTWSHCTIKLLVYKLHVLVKSYVITSMNIEVELSGNWTEILILCGAYLVHF